MDKDQTSANKVKIVEEKREEVFGEEYDAFAQGLTRDINEKLWKSISLVDDGNVFTQQFFDIYHDYFGWHNIIKEQRKMDKYWFLNLLALILDEC